MYLNFDKILYTNAKLWLKSINHLPWEYGKQEPARKKTLLLRGVHLQSGLSEIFSIQEQRICCNIQKTSNYFIRSVDGTMKKRSAGGEAVKSSKSLWRR